MTTSQDSDGINEADAVRADQDWAAGVPQPAATEGAWAISYVPAYTSFRLDGVNDKGETFFPPGVNPYETMDSVWAPATHEGLEYLEGLADISNEERTNLMRAAGLGRAPAQDGPYLEPVTDSQVTAREEAQRAWAQEAAATERPRWHGIGI